MKTNVITNIQNNIQMQQEIRILVNNKEVLDAAEEIIADELEVLNRNSKYCHKPAEIAKQFRMSGADLNSFLKDKKVIYKRNKVWTIATKYANEGYTAYFYSCKYDKHGRRRLVPHLVWTDAGRRFVLDLIYGKVK